MPKVLQAYKENEFTFYVVEIALLVSMLQGRQQVTPVLIQMELPSNTIKKADLNTPTRNLQMAQLPNIPKQARS